MPDIVRRRIVATGWVQGVGYRMACARVARRLGVGGSVRNRADGSVEVVAVGSPLAVDQLVSWCRSGPRGARVEGISVTDEPEAGEPPGRREFQILG